MSIPTAQVFVFEPRLTYSVWKEIYHRKRSKESLEKMLRKGVRDGKYIGYRFITIHEEHIGIDWK